jgi:hypothetical protein
VISDIEMRIKKKEWGLIGCQVKRDRKRILVGRVKDQYTPMTKDFTHYTSLIYWKWLVCYSKHPLGWGKEFEFK